MKNKFIFFGIMSAFALTVIFSSCTSTSTTTTREEAYSYFYNEEEQPLTILVMPPINKTSNVEAKDYFYYTLQVAAANLGYYSFPPLLSMETLQTESAYDSELFVESDIGKFYQTFGADLLLFTTITDWSKYAFASSGGVKVGITYTLRSTKTGETVYSRSGQFKCDTSYDSGLSGSSNGYLALIGFIVDTVGTAVQTAVTDYIGVAKTCNYYTLDFPYGKYNPYHGYDNEFGVKSNHSEYSGTIKDVSDNWSYDLTNLDEIKQARLESLLQQETDIATDSELSAESEE